MTDNPFLQKLQQGEVLVSDGATGTNLQKRGLPDGIPSEKWVLDNPDEIKGLHNDFIHAGSNIILTCTFGGTAIRLEHSKLAEKAEEINHRAAKLAKEAAHQKDVLVGGSMGPTGQLIKPLGPLDKDEVVQNFYQQAKSLAEGGVDLLVIETQYDLTEASAAVEGAKSACDLPIVLSFSFDRGTRTMMGVKPVQLAEEFPQMGIKMLGVNCGRSLEENLIALTELRKSTDLPIWFKPNAGMPKTDDNGNPYYDLKPEEMGNLAREWINAGAKVIGGCCGTSPEHLQMIALAAKESK